MEIRSRINEWQGHLVDVDGSHSVCLQTEVNAIVHTIEGRVEDEHSSRAEAEEVFAKGVFGSLRRLFNVNLPRAMDIRARRRSKSIEGSPARPRG